jgi:hypothetical protein
MRKQLPSISFYATTEDLRLVLAAIESKCNVQYVECGLFDEAQRPVFRRLTTMESLGYAATGDSQSEPTYLVALDGTTINIRPVTQRRGGVRFAVDQLNNPGTIVFRPGGTYLDSAIICGMVGTTKDDPIAKQLHSAFSEGIRSRFVAMEGCWVGPGAVKRLREGARLTSAVVAPSDYDLVE